MIFTILKKFDLLIAGQILYHKNAMLARRAAFLSRRVPCICEFDCLRGFVSLPLVYRLRRFATARGFKKTRIFNLSARAARIFALLKPQNSRSKTWAGFQKISLCQYPRHIIDSVRFFIYNCGIKFTGDFQSGIQSSKAARQRQTSRD